MTRFVGSILLGGLLVASSGTRAQDPTKPDEPSQPVAPKPVSPAQTKTERTHYVVRHADPVVLADAVGKHFKGEADVLAAPAGSGNAVLVSGSPTAVAEVVKLLAQLDRKPATVEVEVVLLEVAPKKDTEPDLSGDARTKMEALIKAGQATAVQRIKLTTTEGNPVTTTTGGSKPYVSGAVIPAGPGGRPAQRSIMYHNVGTTVKLTARVGADEAIAVDLDIRDSKVRQPDVADESGAVSMDNSTLTTKVNVPPGKGVAAQAVRTDGKSGTTLAYVVVLARVVEAPKNQ
jgi:type II secretory pathway component GspD/PulD (secretin)